MKHFDVVPEPFYRVSVKALILNEDKTKFLVTQEVSGKWELPGGGLNWGATAQEDVVREVKEEMNIQATKVAANPTYFFTFPHDRTGTWCANVMYETEVENLNFTPSNECQAVQFISATKLPENSSANVREFAKHFTHE